MWFVLEGEKLYLLPVQGSETQWHKNVLQNPSIRIDARGVGAELRATPVTDVKAVKSVVEKFRERSFSRLRPFFSGLKLVNEDSGFFGD